MPNGASLRVFEGWFANTPTLGSPLAGTAHNTPLYSTHVPCAAPVGTGSRSCAARARGSANVRHSPLAPAGYGISCSCCTSDALAGGRKWTVANSCTACISCSSSSSAAPASCTECNRAKNCHSYVLNTPCSCCWTIQSQACIDQQAGCSLCLQPTSACS